MPSYCNNKNESISLNYLYIECFRYGSTEAFLADMKWILHNCIIFNSTASKLTSVAKSLVKVKEDLIEIILRTTTLILLLLR